MGNSTTQINYESNVTEKNVTAKILSEYDVFVISYDKCIDLQSEDYDDIRNGLDLDHYFNLELTNCNVGPEPPDTDVLVSRIPVLREESDGSIVSDVAIFKVWL